MLLVMSTGMVEVGRAMYQASALERALRVGALYAAHQPSPLSATAKTEAENMIRTGRLDGTGPLVLPGMGLTGATINVGTYNYNLTGTAVPVIRATATVPYVPILPGFDKILGGSGYIFNLQHDQAHVGE